MEEIPHFGRVVQEFVEKLGKLSAKELLSYAIKNEREEAEYYSELAGKVRKLSVRALFAKMSDDSRAHEKALLRIFEKLFPGENPLDVDIPPVEVLPFYEKMESVESYLEALRYCMLSELLAKSVYEGLASVAPDEDTKELAMALAVMEGEHYSEIKRVYELLVDMAKKKVKPETLESGAYLFTEAGKARYFLLDFMGWDKRLFAIVRENPLEFAEMFAGKMEELLWVTKVGELGENAGVTVVSPQDVLGLRKRIARFFEGSEKKGVVLVENLGYLSLELGFKRVMDFVLYIKDLAILHGGYLLVTAVPEAFERREWAVITSELELIS